MSRRRCSIHHLDSYSIAAWSEVPRSIGELRRQLDHLLERHPFGLPLAVVLTTQPFTLSERVLRRMVDVLHPYGVHFGFRVALTEKSQ